MLRLVILASVAALALAETKCSPQALGSSVSAVTDLGNRNACICKSGGSCDKLKVEIKGQKAMYSAGALGEWTATLEGDKFKIMSGPEAVQDTLVYPIKGNKYIVYVFCTKDKEPEISYVEFESKAAATSEVLAELKSKYKINVSSGALSKC